MNVPLHEAGRYERLLSEPFIDSRADIAREPGITRARVCQVMGLLKLSEEIQGVLMGLDDHRAIRYFSERRLKPLLMIPDQAKQIQEFNRMLAEFGKSSNKVDKERASCYHNDSIVCVGG